ASGCNMPEPITMETNDTIFGAAQAGKPWPIARAVELKLLLAIVVAQVAVLAGMIAFDGLPLVLGQRIKLKVVPVDPRDFFRGDYVILGYEFTRFDPVSFGGPAPRPGFNAY